MPFCQVSRLTTPKSGAVGSASRPQPRLQRRLVRGARGEALASKRGGEVRVASPGSRRSSSMPLQDAGEHAGALAQQPVEAHAELRRADLRGVGRRDGGDAVGEREPGLQEADGAVVLDAVERRAPAAAGRAAASSAPGTGPGRRGCAPSSPCAGAARPGSAGRRARARPASRARGRCRAARRRRRRRRSPPRTAPSAREAQRRCRASPRRRRRRRGCRAGRRGAARRATSRSSPAARAASSRAGPPQRSAKACTTSASRSAASTRGIAGQQRAHRDALAARAPAGSAPTTSASPPVLTSG